MDVIRIYFILDVDAYRPTNGKIYHDRFCVQNTHNIHYINGV